MVFHTVILTPWAWQLALKKVIANTGFLGVKTIQKAVTYWSTHAFDIQANLAIIPWLQQQIIYFSSCFPSMHKHTQYKVHPMALVTFISSFST